MNFIYTTVGEYSRSQAERNILIWRAKHHIVEFMPNEQLSHYVHWDACSNLALIDAIVCSADGVPVSVSFCDGKMDAQLNYSLEKAIDLSWCIRDLPERCAVRDGRKWRSIPFIIFRSVFDHEMAAFAQDHTHARIVFVPHSHPLIMLHEIKRTIEKYQDAVLDDYKFCGILVRFENGHAQISQALRRKDPTIQSEYYCAAADRRNHSGWVTFKRDQQGLRHDVEMLQMLIDTNANERELHKFFEENPAILMEARLGIPISHAPVFDMPKGWTPDFAISPILGPIDDVIELLELKRPQDPCLNRQPHRGFSSKVKAAIDQVRDYDRCLRNPVNHDAIFKAFGYIPDQSELAVLIGRAPHGCDGEIRERRQSEIDVQIVTYDEILAAQAVQMK